ncbi:hypothetical protein Tco_0837156 [Tanacetum coccineum]
MKGYIHNLERLGHPVSLNLGVSLILISLRKEFDNFVQNYNMHSMGKTINELHAMLKLHEQTLPKNNVPALHAIRAGYPKETMGYSFYYPPENKVLVARNAEFLENSLITQEARILRTCFLFMETGICVRLNEGAVDWKSCQAKAFSLLSSAERYIVAYDRLLRKLVWD